MKRHFPFFIFISAKRNSANIRKSPFFFSRVHIILQSLGNVEHSPFLLVVWWMWCDGKSCKKIILLVQTSSVYVRATWKERRKKVEQHSLFCFFFLFKDYFWRKKRLVGWRGGVVVGGRCTISDIKFILCPPHLAWMMVVVSSVASGLTISR